MSGVRLFGDNQPPSGQKHWLVNYLQLLKYHTDENSLCFGIAYAAMQALLALDLKTFAERAKRIEEAAMAQNKKPDNDILAFFDTVEMRAVPGLYSVRLLGENHTLMQATGLWRTLPLMQPVSLDKDAIEAVHTGTGVYTSSELQQYFNVLGSLIRAAKLDQSQPVSMVFGDADHSLMLGMRHNKWVLIDLAKWQMNQSAEFIRSFATDKEVAKAIHEAFGSLPLTIFNSTAYATKTNAPLIQAIFKNFKQDSLHTKAYKKNNNEHGSSLLHVAAFHGDLEAFKAGLRVGCEVNQLNLQGNSPLHIAAMIGDVELARQLLRAGANIDMTRKTLEQTALMVATESGHVDMVAFLLEKGASEKITDSEGLNAYAYALKFQREEVMPLFKQHTQFLDFL